MAVLALGTNDAWELLATPRALVAMATIVAEFRGTCLVGVILPEHSTVEGWSNSEARTLNQAMRGWANQVVDWAAMSALSGMLTADGIHTTPKSTGLRANAIISAVGRCVTRQH